MSTGFEFRIEWLDAPGVRAPELAATWARYQIWVNGRCVTQVEEPGGTFRQSVFGSLYPLAEWIASNWWLLTGHVRPTSVGLEHWTWSKLARYPWLRQHNLRGAGDGMAWPDLTVVPEGPVVQIVWSSEEIRRFGPLRFTSQGRELVSADVAVTGLAGVVQRVLDRLTEAGVGKTPLSAEWTEIGKADEEEREFCQAAARLGVDPYSVDDDISRQILSIVPDLPEGLREDFLDSAHPDSLEQAAAWIPKASQAASRASEGASGNLLSLHKIVADFRRTSAGGIGRRRPWHTGYDIARAVRSSLGDEVTAPFDIRAWVGAVTLRDSAGGLQGLAAVSNDRCGLALSDPPRFAEMAGARGLSDSYRAFRQAKALGRVLLRPDRRFFLLSAAHADDDRIAGAFAAELLAPAEGVGRALAALRPFDADAACDAVASHFGVSPATIKHQIENQL